MSEYTIPAFLAVVDLVAAIVYACHREWARALYWTGAASIAALTIIIMKG